MEGCCGDNEGWRKGLTVHTQSIWQHARHQGVFTPDPAARRLAERMTAGATLEANTFKRFHIKRGILTYDQGIVDTDLSGQNP
jgi:hypothetical protein